MRRVDLTVEGQPCSKARPRVTSRGAYTPKAQRENAELLGWEIRRAIGGRAFRGNVQVGLIFYRSNRQRIDLDNLVKQVLDAANGIAWLDDSQVTSIVARLEFDGERPRTVISLRDDSKSTMRRGEDALSEAACERCGADFRFHAYPSQKPPRFCSRGCRMEAHCDECGKAYYKESRRQRFCSKPCAAKSQSTREKISRARKAASTPKPKCHDCGRELKRRGAVLCRDCWLASPKSRSKVSVGVR
jgi:Holliday junction resolvase RusA-like endonuclease